MTFSRAKSAGWITGDKITPAQINQLDVDHTKAIDGVAGGAYAPTSPIVLTNNSLKIGGTERMQYVSRNIVRVQPFILQATSGTGSWIYEINTPIVSSILENTGGQAACAIELTRLPNGSTLDEIAVYYDGANGAPHTDPITTGLTMPSFRLYRQPRNAAAAIAITSAITDPTTVQATYEANHSWNTTGIGHTVDLTANRYYLLLQSEAGANYLQGAFCTGVVTTCAITEQDEGG
jgi:hypothetical protein